MRLWEEKLGSLEIFINKNKKKNNLILVIPGGGYKLTSAREGKPIADTFINEGYHAAVLYYREEQYIFPQPILDIAKAIKILNENEFVDEIIPIGFSAGSHALASFACHYKNKDIMGDLYNKDYLLKRIILSYPVITNNRKFFHEESFFRLDPENKFSALTSIEKNITSSFPKTFVWHTLTDQSVPIENSLLLVDTLRKNNVSFEFHVFPSGPHGMALATPLTAGRKDHIDPYVARWIDWAKKWLTL